jgi:carboxymethylenebutenolidase
VVVIQEWWGLNDQIRGVADRMARAGYTALVPDLYRGKSTVEAEEAHHLMTNLNFGDAASQDVRGAVQHLKASRGKVGVTGFCMGGALTILSLTMVPEADAGVVWYGLPPLEYVDASKIKAPLMAPLGRAGPGLPDRQRRCAGGQAAAAGVSLHRPPLPGAPRLRQRDGGGPAPHLPITQYDAAWAQLAWDRSFASSAARWADRWILG